MKPPKPLRKSKISLPSLLIWGIVVLAVILIIVMGSLAPKQEVLEDTPMQPVLVTVEEIEPRSLEDIIVLPARTEADISATLAVEKGGRITALDVNKGDTVTAGQPLLKIDDRQWKTALEQARIELADAERDLKRWEQMQAEGAVSQSEFDAVKRRHDLAVTAKERAQVDFEQCTLSAPFAGIIDARMVELGEYVNEGQPAFRLMDVEPLKVVVSVPERDISRLQKGQTLSITVPALDDASFTAQVDFIAREASPNTFSYPVELIVDTPPENLLPGMIVNVNLIRGMIENAIVIPLASVIPQRGEHVVFLASSNVAQRSVVKLHHITEKNAIISEGLTPGDQLIVAGHRGLQDGVPITLDNSGE